MISSNTKILFASLLAVLLFAPALFAQDSDAEQIRKSQAQALEFLKLPKKVAREKIEAMSARKAANLKSQILAAARGRYPDADHLSYILEHLVTIKATELAQKRLNNLLTVLGVTLLLFTGFFGYIMFDQRSTVRKLQTLLENHDPDSSSPPAPEVYRGE